MWEQLSIIYRVKWHYNTEMGVYFIIKLFKFLDDHQLSSIAITDELTELEGQGFLKHSLH